MLNLNLLPFLYFSIFFTTPIELPVVKIDPINIPTESLFLNDIVKSIEYVPLETNDNCLIGAISNFDITDNYIVISTGYHHGEVFLFNRNGKFLSKIGGKGSGPEDFLSPQNVLIDEDRKCIIVANPYPDKLLFYDFNGKIKRTHSFERKVFGEMMYLFKDKMLSIYPNSRGAVPYTYEIYNKQDMRLLTEAVKTVSYTTKGQWESYSPILPAYVYNGELHLKEANLNDTIYRVVEERIFIPKYVINAGKYTETVELRADAEKMMKEGNSYVGYTGFFETDTFLYISYVLQRRNNYIAYNKKTKRLVLSKSRNGLSNNYDGGPDFWPQLQREKLWYAFLTPDILEASISQQEKTQLKGSKEAIATFSSLKKRLDSEDNPVLIIVKLK